MTDTLRIWNSLRLITAAALLTFSVPLFGEEPTSEDALSRTYFADANLFSLQPDKEMATYRSHSGGSVGPNATLGLEVADKERRFKVSVIGKLKAQRFLAIVTVTPSKEDIRTRSRETEYDLSDLNPRSLEIARDDDGRVYRLNLIPRIVEVAKPRQFKAVDFRLEYWNFPSSPVVVNDQDYFGQLNMSRGPLAWCDIPGLAKIEFSLLHLKDASPLGTLEDGVIKIAHDDTTMRISNVKNGVSGVNGEVLTGGPYRVWVRWNKPTQSVEEFRKSIKTQIVSLKERVRSGDLSLPAGSLERLEKLSESDRISLTSFGLRQVDSDDLEKPVE